MLRMEIACVLILLFLAVIYFSGTREKTLMHKTYSAILVVLMIHLVFDAITVITVSKIDTIPKIWNDAVHKVFLMTMLFTIYLYYIYISELIKHEMEGLYMSNVHQIISKVLFIYLIIAEIILLVAPIKYVETEKQNYASGIPAVIMYLSIAVFLLHMTINFLVHWKYIHPKKRIAIVSAFSIEFIVTALTIMDTTLLLAGMGLTLIAISFFLVLENPDIKLLETAREEKRKADEANASKSAFISLVSHEIRTPMNAIVGMTDLMLEEEHSEKDTAYLKNIKTSGDSLLMIVNDLLDSSKIEAGKMEIIEDSYELRPMLENVKMIVENRIDTKPIEVIIDVDNRIPNWLVGDALRIRQILINLMNNAVKFTEKGSITLKIWVEKENSEGYFVHFSVRDTGQGIRKENLKKLFEAFSQVDKKKNHNKEGTGLGLYISKEFIQMMGGRLSVDSEYGKGTEFFFTIFQKRSDVTEGKTQDTKDISEKSFDNISVLIVDDNVLNIKIETIMLESLGVTVESAISGEKAIELVQDKHFDIIFMDYMMPYMDGLETTRHIRSMANDDKLDNRDYYARVPIIALSGDSMEESVQQFMQAGMNDSIEKPVEKDKLKDMLVKWCEK